MAKKTLNVFFKFGNLFLCTGVLIGVFYCLLIYARLTICAEDLLLLHPLIAKLSTETAAFVSFRLLRRQRVCFWMHSDIHFWSVIFPVVSLSVIRCRPSQPFICSLLLLLPPLAIQLFTSPSCHHCRLLSRFVVPSSASHSLTSASRRHKSGYRPVRYVTNFLLCTAQKL